MPSPPDANFKPAYWLIELPELNPLMVADSSTSEMALGILHWLALEVSHRLDLEKEGVRLRVITAEYHGKYPCLAACRHETDASSEKAVLPDALCDNIETTIRDVIRTTTLKDMIASLKRRSDRAGGDTHAQC